MSQEPLDGADRLRQAAKVTFAINEKLEKHQRVLSVSAHGTITWRVKNGRVEVELKPTL